MRYCPACHSVFPNEFRTCPKDQAELRVASDLQPGMVLRGKYEILSLAPQNRDAASGARDAGRLLRDRVPRRRTSSPPPETP